VELAGIEPTTS